MNRTYSDHVLIYEQGACGDTKHFHLFMFRTNCILYNTHFFTNNKIIYKFLLQEDQKGICRDDAQSSSPMM